MPRPGERNLGHSKHRKSGTPGHNRDMIQTARELNRQNEQLNKIRESRKEPMFETVTEAFTSNKRKK